MRRDRALLNKAVVDETMTLLNNYTTLKTGSSHSLSDFIKGNLEQPFSINDVRCDIIYRNDTLLMTYLYTQEILIPHCIKMRYLTDYIWLYLVRTHLPLEDHPYAFHNVSLTRLFIHDAIDATTSHLSSHSTECFGSVSRSINETVWLKFVFNEITPMLSRDFSDAYSLDNNSLSFTAPEYKFDNEYSPESDDETEEECPVCYETRIVFDFFTCSHSLCNDCHREWCIVNGHETCPVCRSTFPSEKISESRRVSGMAGVAYSN